jgi:hypothetical protein
MTSPDINSTSCAFIPVYCYYDRENGGEIKTPVLLLDPDTLFLTALILDIDARIFLADELKDQFIDAYYKSTLNNSRVEKSLDAYDIFPQLVTILHTDDEEISIYVCELYENSEPYFKKHTHSNIKDMISYKQGIDELIMGGALEPLTEKILVALSEENYISTKNIENGINSIELF